MTSSLRVAAVIALVVIGSTAAFLAFGPGGSGSGGTNATPPPSAVLLARGSFREHDWGQVEFEAYRVGAAVAGRLVIGEGRGDGWPVTVDLKCVRENEDGILMIGGFVVASGRVHEQPPSELAWVAVEPGRAGRASVDVGSRPWAETTDCGSYVDAWLQYSRMARASNSVRGNATIVGDVRALRAPSTMHGWTPTPVQPIPG